MLTRAQIVVALFAGVGAPLGSWCFGAGELAFAMYARAEEYRLDVFALNEDGRRRTLAPTDLARDAKPSVIPLVVGADHWRTAPRISELRVTLAALAVHGCRITPAAPGAAVHAIEIVLHERAREGADIRTTRATASCGP